MILRKLDKNDQCRGIAYSLLISALVVCILLVAIFGLILPSTVKSVRVGHYCIEPFEYGITFYQKKHPDFYSFSVLNDYLVTADGQKTILYDQISGFESEHRSSTNLNPFEKIAFIFDDYFDLNRKAIFSSSNKFFTVTYHSLPTTSGFILTRKIINKTEINIDKSSLSLDIQENDFVFSLTGQLNYSKISKKNIQIFNRIFKTNLTQFHHEDHQEDLIQILQDDILVLNPELPGLIQLSFSDEYTVWLDNQHSLLFFIKPTVDEDSIINDSIEIKFISDTSRLL